MNAYLFPRTKFPDHFKSLKVIQISKRKLARKERQESHVNPIKRDRKYHQMPKISLNQNPLAKKMGISLARANQHLTLLKLPQKQQNDLLQYGKDEMVKEIFKKIYKKIYLNVSFTVNGRGFPFSETSHYIFKAQFCQFVKIAFQDSLNSPRL